jgi:endoglucanase
MIALLFAGGLCAAGFESDAKAIAAKMGKGWNLGNSLEACASATQADETSWGNPKTTEALIKAVKAAGFKTVRIPCAWSGYIEDQKTYKIKATWLARVKEVVGWCVNAGLYTIVNIHWDGGWCEEHCQPADKEGVTRKLSAIWKQIATTLGSFDERLLFAGANEIRNGYGQPSADNIAVQQSYMQTFVDTVRGSGDGNAQRILVIQGYRTDIEISVKNNKMPKDSASGRLMYEVHFYDPYDFCGEGNDVYLWGKQFAGQGHISSWGQEDWVDKAFGEMKDTFVSKGIPVIIGEYGAILRTDLAAAEQKKAIQARNYYLQYVTKAAKTAGLIPVYWDNGATGAKGYGLFDRTTNKAVHQDALDAIIKA